MTIITARPRLCYPWLWMNGRRDVVVPTYYIMTKWMAQSFPSHYPRRSSAHPSCRVCRQPSTCRVWFRKDILIIDTSSHQYTPQHIFHSSAVSQQTVLINHIRGNILIYCNCSSGTSLTHSFWWMNGWMLCKSRFAHYWWWFLLRVDTLSGNKEN